MPKSLSKWALSFAALLGAGAAGMALMHWWVKQGGARWGSKILRLIVGYTTATQESQVPWGG